jgi:hypothetical protein
VWSLLLAAREEGLGGVMTTMPVRREDDVRALFRHSRHLCRGCLLVLGRPVTAPAGCGGNRSAPSPGSIATKGAGRSTGT